MFIYINTVEQNQVHGSSRFPAVRFVPALMSGRYLLRIYILFCDILHILPLYSNSWISTPAYTFQTTPKDHHRCWTFLATGRSLPSGIILNIRRCPSTVSCLDTRHNLNISWQQTKRHQIPSYRCNTIMPLSSLILLHLSGIQAQIPKVTIKWGSYEAWQIYMWSR